MDAPTRSFGTVCLPRSFRPLGGGLVVCGVVLGVLRFRFGIRPAFLDVRVFAIYSVYFENRALGFISKNVTDEVAWLMLLAGLYLLAFTREREEGPAIDALRLRSMFLAVTLDIMWLVASVLFVHGFAFIPILVANTFFVLVAYLVIFRVLRARSHRARCRSAQLESTSSGEAKRMGA